MKSLRLLFVFLFYIAICSCKKNEHIIIPTPVNSFGSVFDSFWVKMNSNYVYWDIDSSNWDRVYYRYKQSFDRLNLASPADNKEAFKLFSELTSGLIDGHFSIRFNPSIIKDSIINPQLGRKKAEIGFYYPYNYYNVDTNYLDKGYHLIFDNLFSRNGVPLTVLSGTIKNKVLYFGCNSFKLSKSYATNSVSSIKPAIDFFFKKLADLPLGCKGIILDFRSNAGGDLWDLNFLFGDFFSSPLYFGALQTKSNINRLDFSPWIPSYITPKQSHPKQLPRIIVLGDRNSASLAEMAIFVVKTIPGSSFIGEQTYGATGPIVDFEVLNAGSFTVSNFMTVQCASAKFKYNDEKIYEGKGILPDHSIPYNFSSLSSGKDRVLEKALDVLN
ncbi:MAG TPA: S41 family peptidase [Sediminibacterium sp.]|nr:S41 family peptidase [Sediminibacterium sp.]